MRPSPTIPIGREIQYARFKIRARGALNRSNISITNWSSGKMEIVETKIKQCALRDAVKIFKRDRAWQMRIAGSKIQRINSEPTA